LSRFGAADIVALSSLCALFRIGKIVISAHDFLAIPEFQAPDSWPTTWEL
jgi:hypothetical protein